jgi:glutamine amidotransferase
MRVTVIDYGAGNLASVLAALRYLGAEPEVTAEDTALIEGADRIVLPGVGHFTATRRLEERGMTEAVRAAITGGIPFLGICVGMQWLFRGSTEAPGHNGLGYFAETCTRFRECREKVPHVGWNSIEPRSESRLLRGIRTGEHFYFTHSFKAPVSEDSAAAAFYIEPFAAAVERENVMGVQFHPEKSGPAGIRVLRNFLEWKEGAC